MSIIRLFIMIDCLSVLYMNSLTTYIGGSYIVGLAVVACYFSYRMDKIMKPRDTTYYANERGIWVDRVIESDKEYLLQKEQELESLKKYEDSKYVCKKKEDILYHINYYKKNIKEYEIEKKELNTRLVLRKEYQRPEIPEIPVGLRFRKLFYML